LRHDQSAIREFAVGRPRERSLDKHLLEIAIPAASSWCDVPRRRRRKVRGEEPAASEYSL
jgi:hypothetical protein